MNYCTKCGKPTDNGIMCEECIISGSPWLSAMKRKEKDLEEEIASLKAENAAFRKALARAIDSSDDVCGYCAYYIPTKPDENCTPCGHLGECVDGVLQHFMQADKKEEEKQ